MKTNLDLRYPSILRAFVIAVIALFAHSGVAFPIITNVVETGGDNDPDDTVPAKWTGVTWTNHQPNEPVPGLAAGAPYTVGLFGNHAPCFVDRNHRYTNASDTIPMPPYLVGQEYIMSGNDNRDNAGYRLDVFVARDVQVYLLIDNRLGDANNTNPPAFDATHMQWVLDEGWAPVLNGINRTGNPHIADEVGIDESADGTINNHFSIYTKRFFAGTFQLKQADNAGQNMYGVVVVPATAYNFSDCRKPPGTMLFHGLDTGPTQDPDPQRGYIGDDGTGSNCVVHLTDANVGGSYGVFSIPAPAGGSNLTSIHMHWRSLVGGDNGSVCTTTQFGRPGADGYSMSWGTDLPNPPSYGNPAEEGAGTGLIVTVDTFDNGGGEAPGLEIKWRGARVAFDNINADPGLAKDFLRKGVFVEADLTVDSAGHATFTYDGRVLTATLLDWSGIPGGGCIMFGARTGGACDNHWIDDLLIERFRPGGVGRPFITAFHPLQGEPGTIITIDGGGFLAGRPDDHCALINLNGRFVDIEVLTATSTQLVGRLSTGPPASSFEGHQLMVGLGVGARTPITPSFNDVQVETPAWVWGGDAVNMAVAPELFEPDFGDLEGDFHSGAPSNGVLTVRIDQDWQANQRFCISARIHQLNTGSDTRFNDPDFPESGPVEFTLSGTRFDCAMRICDLLVKAFAAHPTRPLAINCTATQVGTNVIITVSLANGASIDGGNIDIIRKPRPIRIIDFNPKSGPPGTLITITGDFGDNPRPDDFCAVLSDDNGALIDLKPITAATDALVVELQPFRQAADGFPHQLMVQPGAGRRVGLQASNVVVADHAWAWNNDGRKGAVALDQFIPLFALFKAWHSGGPVGGKLCVTIDEDWGKCETVEIHARIWTQRQFDSADHWDTRIAKMVFTTSGNRFQCASAICDILKKAFASHKRPLKIDCMVTSVGGNAKITVSVPGDTIIQGQLDIILTGTATDLQILHDRSVIPPRAQEALDFDPLGLFAGFPGTPPPERMNVGVKVCLMVCAPASATVTDVQWTIPGTVIKDYIITSDRNTGKGYLTGCSTVALTPADLQKDTICFYYTQPGTSQITLSAKVNGTAMTVTKRFVVKRNPKAEIFYVTGPGGQFDDTAAEDRDNILGEHLYWHKNLESIVPSGEFLRFHRGFIQKINCWRCIFGYPLVTVYATAPNYVPTGPSVDHFGSVGDGNGIVQTERDTSSYGSIYELPRKFTIAGDGTMKLADFANENALSSAVLPYHNQHHSRICHSGDFLYRQRTAADPIFWRFHHLFDKLLELYEFLKLDGTTITVTTANAAGTYVNFPETYPFVATGCPEGGLCDHPPGSLFPCGTTKVCCTVKDVMMYDPTLPGTAYHGTTKTICFDVKVVFTGIKFTGVSVTNRILRLEWTGGGILQQTPSLGPILWSDVLGNPTNVFSTQAAGAMKFYRVRGQ